VAGSTYTVSFDAFEQSGGEDMDLDVAIGSYSDETETLAGGELSSFTYTFTATETGVVTMTLTMPASRWESVAISNLSITGGPLALQRSIAAADFSMEVTADRLVVNFSTSGYTRVDVFDMQGRLAASLLQANASGVQSLSLSAIPSGSYIVRIQQGSQSLMQRISIDR